jgi:hypothetical protein
MPLCYDIEQASIQTVTQAPAHHVTSAGAECAPHPRAVVEVPTVSPDHSIQTQVHSTDLVVVSAVVTEAVLYSGCSRWEVKKYRNNSTAYKNSCRVRMGARHCTVHFRKRKFAAQ